VHEIVDSHQILEGANCDEEGEDAREELGRRGGREGWRNRRRNGDEKTKE